LAQSEEQLQNVRDAKTSQTRIEPASSPPRSLACRRMLHLISVLLSCVVLLSSSVLAADSKRVMILHSFGPLFKPWSDYARTIRAEITRQSKWTIDFSDHSLVNARLDDDKSEKPFIEYLHSLYAEQPVDLIVAVGAPAANFVQRHRQELFPKTPMILTAVEQRRVRRDLLTNYDTVVAVAHDFPAIFESILHVLPNTRTIAIVNGISPNEMFWLGELKRELAPFTSRIELKWYNELSFEQILDDAAKLPPHSAIFWHLLNVDAAGRAHEANDALTKLAKTASAPVFSYDDSFFGEALVGGPMYSVQEGSETTAAAAVRILAGEPAGRIKPPPQKFAVPRYDWRQMQRWSISESILPAGSSIFFRTPSAWETYRSLFLLVCALIVIQGSLIGGLVVERNRRRRAEVETKERMAELAHVNRYSTAGELTATIAHEINQPLGSILTNAETAELMLSSTSPDLDELKEVLADIRRDDERASEVIRRLRSLLKKAPFEARDIDLKQSVRDAVDLLQPLASQRNIAIRTELAPNALRIIGDHVQLLQVFINLIRNGMDALSNQHDAERKLIVSARAVGAMAEVSITDTGPGVPTEDLKKIFDPFFSTKKEGMGMGLSIVRTIVSAHRGHISVQNRDNGTGAIFRISLPLPKVRLHIERGNVA
jgi:signal transduction histidine kinase